MNNFRNNPIVLLFMLIAFLSFGASQARLSDEPKFEVHRIYPYILMTKEALKKAGNLADLNRHYQASWVRQYISVEISTIYKGKIIKSLGKNDTLTPEQKERMSASDAGKDISVTVKYIPENTLKDNEPKELHFTFAVEPENQAQYPGGQQQLIKYLKENAIDKIPGASFKGYDLKAVKFTVNEAGEIINAHIFGSEYQTSGNNTIDGLLLETVRNMPCWKPAAYANGTKVKQEFVFTVGNMENCMINLLNIKRRE